MKASVSLALCASLPTAFLTMPMIAAAGEVLPAQAEDASAGLGSAPVQAEPLTLQGFIAQTGHTHQAKDLLAPADAIAPATIAQAMPEEEEEITITGSTESELTPYQPPDSSLGTRTNTPVLNVPQAIQAVPKQVLEDRGVRSVPEALRNVSGVQSGRVAPDAGAFSPVIRGFQSENILRNGLREESARFSTDTINIERIEVLKGPASVLFGQGDLGGTVNLVTKQPLNQPYLGLSYQVGQFGVHRPAIDASGPLDKNGLAYRLNLGFNWADSFKPFEQSESFTFTPVVRLIDDGKTKLTAELEYLETRSEGNAPDLPADGTILAIAGSQIRRNSNLGDPNLAKSRSNTVRLGYQLEHKFSDEWSFRHELQSSHFELPENTNYTNLGFTNPRNPRRLRLGLTINPSELSSLTINQSVTGKFKTGGLEHQALLGFEYANNSLSDTIDIRVLPRQIDIFNIVTTPQDPTRAVSVFSQDTKTKRDSIGIYFQDQITIGKQLIVLLGGRFDSAKQRYTDLLDATESLERTDSAFSPRAGIVFKPSPNLSFYGSYSQSFKPVIGRTKTFDAGTNTLIEGDPFEPEKGSQFEVGFKANLFKDRLSATLAYYNLVRSNVTTSGVNETFSQLQIGKQRSRGLELDLAGQIVPGWNVVATYAYADATITEDNRFAEGNRLVNVPRHAYSLWTTYELQSGGLKGLGVGLGLFGQGRRAGDLINSFEVPSYLRTDASIFYRQPKWRIGINIQNLFDVNYYEGVRDRNRVIPGAPFAITGTIAFEF
jgi:iron complex outermembrane recepter protein